MHFPAIVEIKPSRRLRAALVFVHLLGFAATCTAAGRFSVAFGLLPFLGWSLQRSLRPFKTTRLMLGMAGEIVLEPGSPREGSANLLGATAFGWLIVLRLGIDTDPRAELDPDAGTTNRRTTALVVLADSVSPADFRRLQIWLRWVVPVSASGERA